MPKTYIFIDSEGMATIMEEDKIQEIAAEYLLAGESFKVFRAEQMKLQVSLKPAADEATETSDAPVRKARAAKPVATKAKKTAAKRTQKKEAKKPAKAAAKPKAKAKTTAKPKTKSNGKGKVGRPAVNLGPCIIPGCGRPSKTRGLCSAHYQQHRRLQREGKPGLMDKKGNLIGQGASKKAMEDKKVEQAAEAK